LEEQKKEEDPFWFYEPSDGNISLERREFLEEWLKPEDVPQGRLDSQLDVHLCNADTILAGGGNQGGKTTLGTIEGIIWSTGELPLSLKDKYPKEKLPTQWPVYGRVTGVDNNSLQMVILKAWQRWLPKRFLLEGNWDKSWSAEYKILTLYSGDRKVIATIQFKTNEQKTKSFQGNPLHWAIFDEEPLKTIYEETLMRFITAKKLKILFSMTPTEGLSWVKSEILDQEDGKEIRCFKAPSITNKHADLDVLRKILDKVKGEYEKVKMRLLGAFVSLSGLVYGNLFNENIHLLEPFKLNKKDYIVYRGLDPHLVKASACTEVAVDRECLQYITGCYQKAVDTEEFKSDLAQRAKERNYRLGWAACDKSADSDIKIFGDRNIFRELKQGKNSVRALLPSQKYSGSIMAGVDEIRKLLKINPLTGEPGMKVLDLPENRLIINAFKNMERDSYANEDKKGQKDTILEGRWDNHACFRYVNQRVVNWLPPAEKVPEYEPDNENTGY
jgi:phage terminase large subunit-like protein